MISSPARPALPRWNASSPHASTRSSPPTPPMQLVPPRQAATRPLPLLAAAACTLSSGAACRTARRRGSTPRTSRTCVGGGEGGEGRGASRTCVGGGQGRPPPYHSGPRAMLLLLPQDTKIAAFERFNVLPESYTPAVHRAHVQDVVRRGGGSGACCCLWLCSWRADNRLAAIKPLPPPPPLALPAACPLLCSVPTPRSGGLTTRTLRCSAWAAACATTS